MFITKPEIAKRALDYLYKVKIKDKTIKFQSADDEQKAQNIERALELGEKY